MQDNQKGSKTPVHLSGCLRLREDIKNKCVSDHKEENNASYFLKYFIYLSIFGCTGSSLSYADFL